MLLLTVPGMVPVSERTLQAIDEDRAKISDVARANADLTQLRVAFTLISR